MNISKKNKSSGMTLIEILIVVALLGLLAAALTKSLSGSFQAGKFGALKAEVQSIANLVSAYQTMKEKMPSTMQDLVDAKLLAENPKDPWGKQTYGITSQEGTTIVYGGEGAEVALTGEKVKSEAQLQTALTTLTNSTKSICHAVIVKSVL
ncbi:MAG: prepilin-type N-terminal cleavage/methylation domain-containing protein [Puniceicoccales bacterium]|jgi:prepilin-type N-terminal cleavage/methylation domain-containing protein|nr:prepilin-type N-terminal cleavage/methylation domain-containing protein [Puniceicoccales bacterium]